MKYRNILIRFAWLCLLPLVMVGCTDWDAHYDEDNQKIWAEKTLWEEIASRPQLEEFMELLEQYGYKEMLNGSQMYTVFAPEGALDTVGLSSEKIRTEVIENHIARFALSANNATNKKNVTMLNTKSILFTQNGDSYSFGNNQLTVDHNIIAKNGVLHIIEGQQHFFHNVWEYLTTDVRFDSICNYLYSFNEDYLDEDKSVKGEINAEGKQEYLDSVIISYNQMMYYLGQLNNEDSLYTMIVPTNEAWKEAYPRVEQYYQYSDGNKSRADSLKRHYTTLAMVRDLVFSHTVQKSVEDSLISTNKGKFYKPFEEGNILSGYSDWEQAVECSNGRVFVVEQLRHKPWQSWHEEIKVEAENSNALVDDTEQDKIRVINRNRLGSSDELYTKISSGAYLEMLEKQQGNHPLLVFNVWNTLKGKYRLKIVFLPQMVATSKNKTELPNMFGVRCFEKENYTTSDKPLFEKKDIKNDPMRIDTVEVGVLDLTNCVYGLDKVGVKIELKSSFGSKAADYKKYSGTFLIDCIILEPVKE